MNGPVRSSPSTPDHPVWASLSLYTVGPEDAALSFAERLARENGWTLAQAERVFEQYAGTLKAYEAAFGPAPADIWPDAARRLLEHPRARPVHPRDTVIVPRRPRLRLLGLPCPAQQRGWDGGGARG